MTPFNITLLISELYCIVSERMSKQITDDCFGRAGVLSDAIINEHVVPSLRIGAAESIMGPDGTAMAFGLTIAATGGAHSIC